MKNLFLFLLLFLTLAGCLPNHSQVKEASIQLSERNAKKIVTKEFFKSTSIKPIDESNHSITRVHEWKDEESIIYEENSRGINALYSYHLRSGKKELIYETNLPIVAVKVNRDQSLIAIQELKTNYEMTLTVLNQSGNTIYKSDYFTYEFHFFWNPYNSNDLLLVSMLQNWEFTGFVLNVESRIQFEIKLDNPFIQWAGTNKLLYLNWKNEESHVAPLYIYHLESGRREQISQERFIGFNAFFNVFLTISEGSANEAVFEFYDINNMQKKRQLSLPIINTYSEYWWVPEHEYVHQEELFYFVQPDIDKNNTIQGFELTSIPLNNSTSKKVLDLTESAPIKCAPTGDLCLYGKQFEKIIDIKQQRITKLYNN